MKRLITTAFILSFATVALSAAAADGNADRTETGKKAKGKVYMVSNAHMDTQWNWDVRTTIGEYVPNTMRRNFVLFEKFPEYVFNFEGAIKYSWMKEYYPAEYELVKRYIREGRWNVCGSTWDATDPNMPSSESFVRNILYGQKYYAEEFGVQGNDIFLPDCFGFGWTLPSIAAHCGLKGFSTQKLQWRVLPFYGDRKNPFPIGLWEGIDGSRIMMADDAHKYSQKYKFQNLKNNKELIDMVEDSGLGVAYKYYGVGDVGGSPEMESVRTVVSSVGKEGPIDILIASAGQIYEDYYPFENHPELPVWKDELLMDVHATGCYTSQAAMKLFNRRNEQLADAAERSSVAAEWLGASAYPAQTLETAWKRFIWHQFHDDLTGTSIPRAYEFSWNDELISLNQFASVLDNSVQAVAANLDTKVQGVPVVVYNALDHEVGDMVTINVPDDRKNYNVYDSAGRKVRSQKLSDGRLAFEAVVPAVGYAVFDLRVAGTARTVAAARTTSMENSVYALQFDVNGDICSIVDKRSGRQLVADGKAFRLALFTENVSTEWPAWEIIRRTVEADPVAVPATSIELVENGAVAKTVKVTKKYGESVFEQYVTLHEGALAGRIDVLNKVHWAEMNALLKAEFPMAVSNPKAWYDLGLGAVQRDNNTDTKYEVYAAQWADLTDVSGDYGVAVLNDCKYGWDKPADNTIRLTLLHTPKPTNRYVYQNVQDHGDHVFTYSIVGHEGDYRQGGVVREAELLNQGAKAWTAAKHKGVLGRKWSFASSDNAAVAIRSIKKAEDGDGYIVRVYETSGKGSATALIKLGNGVTSACQLNGCEQYLADAQVDNGKLKVEIGPYGIRTYRVRLDAAKTASAPVTYAAVALPFNERSASYNDFRGDVNFDMIGNSMAAELIPETIEFGGVSFPMADPLVKNSLRCEGQTIKLPNADGGRLMLLCTSTQDDLAAEFTLAGGAKRIVNVPYYTDFVGQWGHTGQSESYFKGVDVAWVGTHRHSMSGNRDLIYDYSYIFCNGIDIPAGCTEVTLPKDMRLHIFSAVLKHSNAGFAAPALNLTGVEYPAVEFGKAVARVNLLKDAAIVAFSAEQSARETASNLVDESPDTKWCDAKSEGAKFVEFDLGEVRTISDWYVLHAGFESPSYLTCDFQLQVRNSSDEPWRDADSVSGNTDYITNRTLETPVQARYVRLNVTRGTKTGGAARIYEFAIH